MEKKEKVQRILNGHNESIQKVEGLLSGPVMKLVMETQNKSGEELAGVMNFWMMEIQSILRKAGAVGYNEAMYDIKETKLKNK